MEIKELYMTAFGKYENKRICFQTGLNIIYGENESGKSTIHKFIEAMFFGFFKDQKNRRAYSDDYEKYLPLYLNSYGGTLIYNDGHREIRVERNLLKSKDQVTLFDNHTGEDISFEFFYDKGTKLYHPLDPSKISRRVYNNTISISQLGCGTAADLAVELKDKLANYGGSKSDLSVKNVIQTLTNSINALGTERRKNTPFYEAATALEKLQLEKENLLRATEKATLLRSQVHFIDEEITELLEEQEVYLKQIEACRSFHAFQKLQEYQGKIDENNKVLDELSNIKYTHVSEEDYNHINKLYDFIENHEKQRTDLREQWDICDLQMKETEKSQKSSEQMYSYEEVESDKNEMQNLRNEKSILEVQISSSNHFLMEDKLKELKGTFKSKRLVMMCSLLIGIVGFLAGLLLQPTLYLICLLLPISFFAYRQSKEKRREIGRISEKLNKIKGGLQETEERLNGAETRIKHLYGKYNCSSWEEFLRGPYEMYKKSSRRLEEGNEILISLKERKRNYEELITKYNLEIESNLEYISQILKRNKVNTPEELKENYFHSKRAEELRSQVERNQSILETIIPSEDLKTITESAKRYSTLKGFWVQEELSSLLSFSEAVEKKIKAKEIEKSNMEGQVESTISCNENLSDIENEIGFIEKEIKALKSKERSLRLAMDTIQGISEEIHKELAPELNQLLGRIIKEITNKYHVVKVSKDIEIRLEDPKFNQLLHIDHLSSGTIDQVYFAFRMALNEFLGKNKFPILLDEPFVQYDDNRISNVLEYLVELGKERQILLFTSQKREAQIIKGFTDDFNVIELG